MTAYLAGDYAASVARLSQWLAAAPSDDAPLAGLAHAAVAKLGVLAQGEDRAQHRRGGRKAARGNRAAARAAELSDAPPA